MYVKVSFGTGLSVGLKLKRKVPRHVCSMALSWDDHLLEHWRAASIDIKLIRNHVTSGIFILEKRTNY